MLFYQRPLFFGTVKILRSRGTARGSCQKGGDLLKLEPAGSLPAERFDGKVTRIPNGFLDSRRGPLARSSQQLGSIKLSFGHSFL